MRTPVCRPPGAGLPAVLLVLALMATRPAPASDVGGLEDHRVGHPRDRFPLTLALPPTGDATLEAALEEAVEGWNGVAGKVLGVPAFRPVTPPAAADVEIVLTGEAGEGAMGLTSLSWTDGGQIRLPVRIELARPRARGQTTADRVLFQVAAHELGHALGLPHLNEPGSIMCCDHGRLDLSDPGVRAAYVAARRRPEIASATDQLATHYRAFWGP